MKESKKTVEKTPEKNESKTYGCSDHDMKMGLCCRLGVDPKHWHNHYYLCCNTGKICKYRKEVKN